MTTALLLVDLQNDFLRREGLFPAAADIVDRCTELLWAFRRNGWPVFHCRTHVARDGRDRMPHWIENGVFECVEGSAGAQAPEPLAERDGEPVFHKRFFSGFEASGLDAALRERKVDHVVVAGVYLHGCVRATVLEAYQRGYRVSVAREATGSTELLHAEVTRDWLDGRAAKVLGMRALLRSLGDATLPPFPAAASGCIDGRWHDADGDHGGYVHRDPERPADVLHRIAFATPGQVREAVAVAHRAQPAWEAAPLQARREGLLAWKAAMAGQRETIVASMVRGVGKPRAAANEEFDRALRHIDSSVRLAAEAQPISDGVEVAHRAVGTIAAITPWNNPVAIPVAKLAAALVQGNTVVWKPASQSTGCARLVLETLAASGLPTGLVQLLHGDAECVRELVRAPGIAAVAMTGSEAAGAQVRAWCALHAKPLQAELGGNNAALVMADADVDAAVAALVPAAYSYSGQRCTAIRRLVVVAPIADAFRQRWVEAVARLRIGAADEQDTDIGPLISVRQYERIASAVGDAISRGARCVTGGRGHARGRLWFSPTLLECADPQDPIVQRETFGPVAVLQIADDAAHAIRLANAVPQGLLGAVFTRDPVACRRIGDALQVGILRLAGNIQRIDPDAPFGGWKGSQIGPPEHGAWDRQFFGRPQARYST